MTNHIKAIFFDLDGTLRIPTPGPTTAFIHFARTLDIEISPLTERHVKVWAHQYWGQAQLVKQDMERFDANSFWINYSRLLLERVNVTHDLMQRAQMVQEWFDRDYQPQVELAPGSYELLSELREMGFILGVISNRTHTFENELKTLGLNSFFDVMLAAGEVGYWKPHPQIFWQALTKFSGLRAGECLYVGDNYYADATGAEAAGMIPVLYDPEDLYEKSSFQRIQHMGELQRMVRPLNGNGRVLSASPSFHYQDF